MSNRSLLEIMREVSARRRAGLSIEVAMMSSMDAADFQIVYDRLVSDVRLMRALNRPKIPRR